MTKELVTLVRYRNVIEEVVVTRDLFDELNNVTWEDADACIEAEDKINALPFQDWQWGTADFVKEHRGFMAFKGDVVGHSDDLASLSTWQYDLPLTLDSQNYFEKLGCFS